MVGVIYALVQQLLAFPEGLRLLKVMLTVLMFYDSPWNLYTHLLMKVLFSNFFFLVSLFVPPSFRYFVIGPKQKAIVSCCYGQ